MTAKLPASCFEYYFSLGPSRSYQAVADEFGVTKRAVTKRAARERWQERVSDLERRAQESVDERAVEDLQQMNERHLKALRAIQGKAIQALREMSIESAMEAVRALDLSIKQERTIRGEPSSRTAVSVEERIRSEYDRWLVAEGLDESEDP